MTKDLWKMPTILLLAFMAAVFLTPILVVFTNSFMSVFEIVNRYTHLVRAGNIFYSTETATGVIHYVRITLIPYFASFEQYISLFFDHPRYIGRFWNSVALAVPIVIGHLLISAPAAYAFHFSRLRFKEGVYFTYIIIMLVPLQVALVPNFIMAGWLGLMENRLAIILPAIVNPFGVFLIRQFLYGLTMDHFEAAQIDGAGHIRILVSVVAPMFKPALASLAILSFIENWNLVEQPLIFLTAAQEPLSVYLSQMANHHLDLIFAASFFYLLPTLLLFLFWKEHMVEGIMLSGVK